MSTVFVIWWLIMKNIFFDTIPSTNLYLKENYETLENMTVICARHQTEGRGRNNRKWVDGNDLLFSILIKNDLEKLSVLVFIPTPIITHSILFFVTASNSIPQTL